MTATPSTDTPSTPADPQAPEHRDRTGGSGRLRARLAARNAPRYSAIWVATALLFAFSPLLASNSLTASAITSMLAFAALLAIAAIGQTLVIQQRGLDLTVPGMILLTTVILTQYASGASSRLPVAVLLVFAACVASGLLSGIAITQFGITPIVATLGVNALLTGLVYQLTSGQATATSPTSLSNFAGHKTLGLPNTAVIAVIALVIVATLIRATIYGRRFVAVGANPAAARVAGIPVTRYLIGTYVMASLSYGVTGILFAGYFSTPGLAAGSDYLLPTVAAVVLGGTSLAGGSGSVIATAGGVVFLTQLQQVLTANGAAPSVEYMIQGTIIALGMLLRLVPWGRTRARVTRLLSASAHVGSRKQHAAAAGEDSEQ